MSEIKVIRDATKDIYQIECRTCSSELEFTYQQEVKGIPAPESKEITKIEYAYYIHCPCCNGIIRTRLKLKDKPKEDYRFNVTETRELKCFMVEPLLNGMRGQNGHEKFKISH